MFCELLPRSVVSIIWAPKIVDTDVDDVLVVIVGFQINWLVPVPVTVGSAEESFHIEVVPVTAEVIVIVGEILETSDGSPFAPFATHVAVNVTVVELLALSVILFRLYEAESVTGGTAVLSREYLICTDELAGKFCM
jgi:hypothetical protein